MDKSIVISIKTILLTFLLVLGAYMIFRLGAIIGAVFIAFLITISLEHTVKFFCRQTFLNKKIGRSSAVLITYFIAFLFIALGISIGLDPVISQSQKLYLTLMKNKAVLNLGGNVDISLSDLINGFVTTSGGIAIATKSLFSNIAMIVSILILSIYMSIDWDNIKSKLMLIIPEKEKSKTSNTLVEIEDNVGIWLKGQILLMFAVGTLSYLAVVLVGVDFPLALGIIAGILEIVPMLGPVISAVIAGLVAFAVSPGKAALIILAFIIIQQIENNILVPKIMQKASGFSPIIILITLLIFSDVFGIVGAIIAVPSLMIGVAIFRNISS